MYNKIPLTSQNVLSSDRIILQTLPILRLRLRSKGLSYFGAIVTILLCGIGYYLGSQLLSIFYSYFELRGLMEAQAAKATVLRDDQIRRNIFKEIQRLEIPIQNAEDIGITRLDGKIIIELDYSEVLYVDFGETIDYNLYEFKFNPVVEHLL